MMISRGAPKRSYLLNPPVLVPPVLGRSLLMYLVVHEFSMACVLDQYKKPGWKQQAIYYLIKILQSMNQNILHWIKLVILCMGSQRLRRYMLCYTTLLTSRIDPLKYIFENQSSRGDQQHGCFWLGSTLRVLPINLKKTSICRSLNSVTP